MNTSQNKKPWLYIGLIAFLAIAAIGIVYDFISKSGGIVAIISVVVAFLILAGALVVDTVSRKRAAKEDQNDGNDGWSGGGDNRFLRHTEEVEGEEDYVWKPNNTSRSGFAGFARRAFGSGEEPAEAISDDAFDDFPAEDMPESADPFAPVQTPVGFEDDLNDDAFADMGDIDDISDDEVYSFSEDELAGEELPGYEEDTAAEQQPEEDDPFKPVLKLNGAQPEEPEEPALQPEPVQEEVVSEVKEEQPVAVQEEPAPVAPSQPEEKPVVPAPVPEQKPTAKERRAAAAVPAAAVAATSVGGQTIESFYEGMSEEDILYRDCVEVWAADGKAAVEHLIKYVEGIEDKQTAALIGREVEYVNAMVDRINRFTQLEYIDELLEYREHNYSTLVKDCLKRFSPFFMEKRLGLLWKGLEIDVMVDRDWFIFALTQVVFNAVEFTPNGGKIAISAKKHEDYIDLTVEDSGKGISPDELPFVFMAGYMGDDVPNESERRTGMGLFIAQSVMRKMGGDMLAESTPGKGTRITLRMPIIEPIV